MARPPHHPRGSLREFKDALPATSTPAAVCSNKSLRSSRKADACVWLPGPTKRGQGLSGCRQRVTNTPAQISLRYELLSACRATTAFASRTSIPTTIFGGLS